MTDDAPRLIVDGRALPIDILLDLVRSQRIDLAGLPIAALIASFADALEQAVATRTAPLGRWGDWLVMAATLALMASQLLRPADPASLHAAEVQAEALRQTLLARRHVAGLAVWLDSRPRLGRDVFARGQPQIADAARPGDVFDLYRACLPVLAIPAAEGRHSVRLPALWRPADAAQRILALIDTLPAASPLEAYLPPRPRTAVQRRAAVASTLVASLELARQGCLALDHPAPFGPIGITRVRPE